jgi:hypothetical protein
MPVALHSWIVEKDGGIRVRHTFFADTEEEADRLLKQHATGCAHFGPATAAGETIEVVEDIDELPDAESLEDFEEDDLDEGDDEEEE